MAENPESTENPEQPEVARPEVRGTRDAVAAPAAPPVEPSTEQPVNLTVEDRPDAVPGAVVVESEVPLNATPQEPLVAQGVPEDAPDPDFTYGVSPYDAEPEEADDSE